MSTWFNERIQAITICLQAGFPEAALALLYSAIDTLGFLDAQACAEGSDKHSFIGWCDKYPVPLTESGFTGTDLYGARCGILQRQALVQTLGKRKRVPLVKSGMHSRAVPA